MFRADAAFANPEIYEALEARDVKYAKNLERDISELLARPVGPPTTILWSGTRVFCWPLLPADGASQEGKDEKETLRRRRSDV